MGLRLAVVVLPLARVLAWEESRDDIARARATLRGRPHRGRRMDRDAALSVAIAAVTALCIFCGVSASVILWLRGDNRTLVTALPAGLFVAAFIGSGALATLWMARLTYLEATRFEQPSWVDDLIAIVAASWVTYLVI